MTKSAVEEVKDSFDNVIVTYALALRHAEELDRLRAENKTLLDRAEQAELDRDMWKAEVRRTTDEYVATTKEALREVDRLRAEREKGVLVPREPSDAMEAAATPHGENFDARAVYKAMLAAAEEEESRRG